MKILKNLKKVKNMLQFNPENLQQPKLWSGYRLGKDLEWTGGTGLCYINKDRRVEWSFLK